jgi:hypothetical protein
MFFILTSFFVRTYVGMYERAYIEHLNGLTDFMNPLMPTCFNIPKLRILPTECIYVFRTVLTINNDCSLNSNNRLGFVAVT